MRNKIIFGLIVSAIAVPVFASLITISSTIGIGMAASGNTTGVTFQVLANQTTHDSTTTVSGNLVMFVPTTSGINSGQLENARQPNPSSSAWPTPPPHYGSTLRVNVTGYTTGSDPNAAQLTGPSTLRVTSPSGSNDYPGTTTATLVSNRHPDEMGNPDTLDVHFVPTHSGDPTLDFTGNVTQGDITISETDSY
jgi:hypothetical protein